MRRESWQRVDAVFAAALEVPAAELAAFLDQACGAEPGLRQEVESLLEADAAAGARASGFLAAPDVRAATEPGAGHSLLRPGQTLGPYRLNERLGAGGMGEVFAAERVDGELERQVAIKVIWRGGERQELRRFQRERQLLAALDHPHIARLYDAGTSPEGLPYLVMERIDGAPIDAYCDRHRLSIAARLRLFLDLCDAVETAHRSLMVHRDLKPANVLVTPGGVVKLLDFGIAKLLEEEGLVDPRDRTRTFQRALTPSYASPEQARGGVLTTATDVYSLGVLLFELLTGSLPASEDRILESLASAKPWPAARRPSQALDSPAEHVREAAARRGLSPDALRRRLAGDLDAIALKALEEDPRLRYPGVGPLAADLRRHLDRRPVEARTLSWRYRTGKFLRRHRTAAAATALAVVAAGAFVTTIALQARRLGRERTTAQRTAEFLTDLFGSASPEHTGAEPATLRSVLDRGAERVQRELRGEPEVQAALIATLADAYLDLGLTEPAEPLLAAAAELRRRTAGERSPELAEVWSLTSDLRWHQGRYAEAEELARRAAEVLRQDREAHARQLAVALQNLGGSLVRLERLDEAEKALRESLAAARAAGEPAAREEISALTWLAIVVRQQGRLDEAKASYEELLQRQREVHGPRHLFVARALANLGVVHIALGRNREAAARLSEALAMLRELGLREHVNAAHLHWNLAGNALELGEFAAARAHAEESVRLRRELLPPGHPELADSLETLGRSLRELELPEEAEGALMEALAIRRAALGERHPDVARSFAALAELHAQQRRAAAAAGEFEASLAILGQTLGPGHPQLCRPLAGRGRLAQSQGRAADAERDFRKVLTLLERRLPRSHHHVAQARGDLGAALLAQGRLEEAERLLLAARPILQAAIPAHPRTRAVEDALADLAARRAKSAS
jgi:serine/threonine-protein kinase